MQTNTVFWLVRSPLQCPPLSAVLTTAPTWPSPRDRPLSPSWWSQTTLNQGHTGHKVLRSLALDWDCIKVEVLDHSDTATARAPTQVKKIHSNNTFLGNYLKWIQLHPVSVKISKIFLFAGDRGGVTSDESQDAMRIFATSPLDRDLVYGGHRPRTDSTSSVSSQDKFKCGAFASDKTSENLPSLEEELAGEPLLQLLPRQRPSSAISVTSGETVRVQLPRRTWIIMNF